MFVATPDRLAASSAPGMPATMTDGHTGKPFVPSYVTVVRVAQAHGLPPDGLLSRVGYEPWSELSDEEKKLMRGFRSLDVELRARLLGALEALRGEAGEAPPPRPPT